MDRNLHFAGFVGILRLEGQESRRGPRRPRGSPYFPAVERSAATFPFDAGLEVCRLPLVGMDFLHERRVPPLH